MARYIGSVCALCRREGTKLFLKGDRCTSAKCAFEKRGFAPGQHGPTSAGRRKQSDYAMQLREKQKARRIYGIFERQFRRYFAQASKSSGVTGAALLQILESRLDNIVYRLGLAVSRRQARQVVLHGHIMVNGKIASVPSMLLNAGDRVSVVETSRKSPYFEVIGKDLGRHGVPEWLSLDSANLAGSISNLPSRQQIDTQLKEQLIVEYYSR
jgi:small subunit ribosomal protein S4